MKTENLQAGLRVRVIRWLEPELVDSHLGKEDLHESNQSPEREAEIRNYPFYLMEFGQMSCVDAFVAENSVNGKVPGRPRVGCQFVKHVC